MTVASVMALEQKMSWLAEVRLYLKLSSDGGGLRAGLGNPAPLLDRAFTAQLCSVPLTQLSSRCMGCFSAPRCWDSFPAEMSTSCFLLWPKLLLLCSTLLRGKLTPTEMYQPVPAPVKSCYFFSAIKGSFLA